MCLPVLCCYILNGNASFNLSKFCDLMSQFSDGYLDVIIIKDCPKSAFMSILLKMKDGSHVKSPYVTYLKVHFSILMV